MLRLQQLFQQISWPKLLTFQALLLLLLGSSHLFYNGWNNTIEQNEAWESSKTKLDKGVFAARYFTLTFTALANEHLDLSVAHGFQEVFWRKPCAYEQLNLDFKLSPNAFLDVMVAEKNGNRDLFRFSNAPEHLSGLIEEKNFAFQKRVAFQTLHLAPDVWHKLSLKLSESAVIVAVDDSELKGDLWPVEGNILGLRGGDQHVWVDNISIKGSHGEVLFEEDFARKYNALRRWGLLAFLFVGFNICFLFAGKYRRRLGLLLLNLSLVALVLFLFFRLYYQDKYPKAFMVAWNGHASHIERAIDAKLRLAKELEKVKSEPDGRKKLMFLGSSQIWGAGASNKHSDFESQLELNMAASCGQHPIRLLNMGISGFTGAKVYENYSESWIDAVPDFVLIDLGTNDHDAGDLKAQLRKVIQLNQERGIQTFIVLESNTHSTAQLDANHLAMTELAAEYEIPVLDPTPAIQSKIDKGFVFWDSVHFTDYGQKIFADIVWRFLSPYLCSGKTNNGVPDES